MKCAETVKKPRKLKTNNQLTRYEKLSDMTKRMNMPLINNTDKPPYHQPLVEDYSYGPMKNKGDDWR